MINTHNNHPPFGGPLVPKQAWPPAGPARRVAAAVAAVARLGPWGDNSQVALSATDEFVQLQAAETDSSAYAVLGTNVDHMVELMLMAAGIGEGDEVIIPVMAPPAIKAACEAVSAVPVMVGILPGTYCLDPHQVKRAINGRTKAIFAVHLHGSMADMDRLRTVAAGKLALFEECSDAVGAQWDGIGAGMIGDGGTFSFHGYENLPAHRAGGAITKWPCLADRVDMARNRGRRPKQPRFDETQAVPDWWCLDQFDPYRLEPQSGNYRIIGGFEAVLLDALCQQFPKLNEERLAGKAELDEAVWQIRSGGVPVFRPMVRQPHVTASPTNAYVLRYDEAALGIPVAQMCEILTSELWGLVERPYKPLSDSDQVANQAYREALVFHHTVLLRGAGALVECFKRIVAHQDELRRVYVGAR